jgi:ubiquinone/menaquinone biosynthesis C-methylase UbiE
LKNFAKFWDRIAPSYSKRPVADEAAYQHKLEKTREYLTPEMSVFEFGCGTGTTGIHHAPYVKSVRAIDVSKNMIDIARGKAAAKNIGNVEFEVAGIEESSLRDNEYDVVMAHSILHLLTDIEPVLAKVHRTLKPDGVFVSSTICVGDSIVGKVIGTVISSVSPTGWVPYINAFSTKRLMAYIEGAGFRIDHQWRPRKNSALFLVAKKI